MLLAKRHEMDAAVIYTRQLPDGTIFQWKVDGKQGSFGCHLGFHKILEVRKTSDFIYKECARCNQRVVWLRDIKKDAYPDRLWLSTGKFADHGRIRRPEDPPSITR